MRKGIVLVIALVSAWMFAVGCGTQPWIEDPVPRSQIHLSSAQVVDTNTWIRAFVETGSDSPEVLVALNEAGSNTEQYEIRHIGAATRSVDGQLGLLITIWFEFEVPEDIVIIVTVSQPGAEFFGDPQPYFGS